MLAFYLTMIPEEDREDFTDLYNRYEKRMLYIARQRTGDEHLAEDVVQETFLIIAKDFEKFSPKKCHDCRPLIDKIVRRQSSNALRRTHREDPIEGISAELDPSLAMEDVVVSQDAVERIIALVGKMKENYREVLRLKYENDYSHEEISDILGITVDAAKQRLHRARNKLKLMMEAEEVGGNGK